MSQLLNTAKRHSIVAAYEFDEASGNLLDKIGSNNGTASGTPVYGATDQLGGTEAIEFDGVSDYFDLDSDTLNGVSAYTVAAIVKQDNAGLEVIFGGTDGATDGVNLFISSNTFRSRHNSSTTTSTTTITYGQYYHAVATWDGSDVRLYVDGQLEDTTSDVTAISTSTADRIGALGYGAASLFFDGSIAFLAVFDEALSATDIQELYQAGRLKPSLTLHHDLSASAIDSNLTSYAGRVASNNFSAAEVAAIFAADSGSGADVWFSSDASGATPIDAKLLYWSDGDSVFAFDVAIASASSSTGATVYLQVGNKPSGYGTDPYPATAEIVYGLASDLNDATSNANNGTGNGGIVAGGVTGPDGSVPATEFDGSDDYIGSPTLSAPTITAVRGWFYQDTEVTGSARNPNEGSVASFAESASSGTRDRSIVWDGSANTYSGYVFAGGSAQYAETSALTATGEWQHIAFSHSNPNLKVYYNGTLEDTNASATTPFTGYTNPEFYLGLSGTSSNYFDGRMANVRVDSAAPSDAEINADYLLQGSSASTYWTVTDISSSDPLGDKSIELGASHVYVFDEASGKLLDRVGSNDGTASGTPTYRESDQRGLPSAIGFDGSTDYFTLAGNTLNGASAYTIELLVKINNLGVANNIFCERDAGTDGVRLDNNGSNFRWRHNAVDTTGSTALSTGEWYHLIVTWDGSDTAMYLNGASDGTASVATAISTSSAARIGEVSFTSGTKLNGDISHVAIYPRALTATEVGELYDVGTPKWAEIRSAVRPAVRKAVRDLTYI